ncbi:MAG: hypothetical protein MUC50_15170 [Myxococcota bacterium]|jgi:hypothetical protein|nr:hypothetical protein [Myxococcota bacterium]
MLQGACGHVVLIGAELVKSRLAVALCHIEGQLALRPSPLVDNLLELARGEHKDHCKRVTVNPIGEVISVGRVEEHPSRLTVSRVVRYDRRERSPKTSHDRGHH